MNTVGIVAEYDPFHNGHAMHLEETRRLLGEETAVVCVMSGSWTQRGACALTDKWTRAELALRGGADLVLELPFPWAVSSAEGFARGAAELLSAAGVDALSFGSEAGEIEPLLELARCLNSEEYERELVRLTRTGAPFAQCRQRAAAALVGKDTAGLLEGPNNNLGVEYLRALDRLQSPIRPVTVKRRGADHNSSGGEPGFASASRIRALARAGEWEEVSALTSEGTAEALRSAGITRMEWVDRAMLARLRTMEEAGFAALPDSSAAEGLPRRLIRAAGEAGTMEEFYALAKTRRYTHARLRRLAAWAFLGLTGADRPQGPAYLRVLGSTGRGREVLREMKRRASLPILTKPAHIRTMDGKARKLFAMECRSTDLQSLCFETPRPCGRDYTTGPVVL